MPKAPLTKTCRNCKGAGQVLGPFKNGKFEKVTCPACGGKGYIII